MANLTIEQLQNIAVRCTSDFYNKQIPLNETLAKEASELDLNSEQLKRAVEATNTLTYLKSTQVSDDRTKEFPVADYNEIVKLACIPGKSEDTTLMKKQACADVDPVVEAENALAYTFPQLTKKEQQLHLFKQAHVNRRAIEDAEVTLSVLGEKLIKLAKVIKNDPVGVEHLSATSIDNADFEKISGLIFGKKVQRADFVNGLFKSAELSDATEFVTSYTEAKKVYDEIQFRKDLMKRADSLEKIAGLSSGLVGLGEKMINGVKYVASKANLEEATRAATSGIKGATVGATKGVFSPITNTVKQIGSVSKFKIQNALANKIKKVPKPVDPVAARASLAAKGAAALTGVGIATDMFAYTPKVDPQNDMAGTVWDNLQGK